VFYLPAYEIDLSHARLTGSRRLRFGIIEAVQRSFPNEKAPTRKGKGLICKAAKLS
jgi:hypothetical protein